MREYYPQGHKSYEIVRHPCLILIPYQVSLMSFFELYRLAIPMYVPSQELLLKWHFEYDIVWERSYGHPDLNHSQIYPESQNLSFTDYSRIFEGVNISSFIPVDNLPPLQSDPNAKDSFRDWIKYCDFYQFKHIQTFDNFTHLLGQIEDNERNGGHRDISRKMTVFNEQVRVDVSQAWKSVFSWIRNNHGAGRKIPDTENTAEAIHSIYGMYAAGGLDNKSCQ